jgi:hypothetical protein
MNHLLTGVTGGRYAQEKCHSKVRRALSVFSVVGRMSRSTALVDRNKSVLCKTEWCSGRRAMKATVWNEKEDG